MSEETKGPKQDSQNLLTSPKLMAKINQRT